MDDERENDCRDSKSNIDDVSEEDLDNNAKERLLRRKLRRPICTSSSDSEDDNVNDGDKIYKTMHKNKSQKSRLIFVPCLSQRALPYPKLSAINENEHYQCMRVLCAENPHILPEKFVPPPSKKDRKLFKELKTKYENEQKEFIAWAKRLWSNNHSMRALNPKPDVEMLYKAMFKMRAMEMSSYPKSYELSAVISLLKNSNACEMVLDMEIIMVDIQSLPQIRCMQITKKLSIIQPYNLPEPCTKHPCKFILPTENAVSILPLTEVLRELAQFGWENNAQFVVSEDALKCLVELDRPWDITVAVTSIIGLDGETTNVVVLGSEFAVHKEPVLTRTYQAFRHLLLPSLVPSTFEECLFTDDSSGSDDTDDGKCGIDEVTRKWFAYIPDAELNTDASNESNSDEEVEDDSGGSDSCACKGTIFERPPPRSFSRWQVRDNTTGENYSVIVHCAHQVRGGCQARRGEVILEPIPEYQLELGGSAQPPGRIRSLGLSLHLRKDASVINVRVDGATGEVATLESMDGKRFRREHGDVMSGVAQTLHAAFSHLKGLQPGNYILRHVTSYGSNAMLYAAKSPSDASMMLDFDYTQLQESDESKSVRKTAPTLVPVLLPAHKFRKILPCAFTPDPSQVAQEPRAPLQRKKVPPRALQVLAPHSNTTTPPVNTLAALRQITTLDSYLSY